MSILEDYRRFQEEQRAKGIDPSVAPRLTQEEQDILRQEIATTSVDTTTADSPPSTDVSSPPMLQSQERRHRLVRALQTLLRLTNKELIILEMSLKNNIIY